MGGLLLIVAGRISAEPEDRCRTRLREQVKACADDCLARTKAAVAPDVRDRILGYGCWNNCMKLEMFNGNTCPR